MTNSKKPRESRKPVDRKPLDQSFLEFVQGAAPEPAPTTTPEPGSAATAQLAQDLVTLQHRLTQSEQASQAQDPRLSQMEARLSQLSQQVEQMDQNASQPILKLQQQFNDLEQILLERESRQFSRVEQQLIHLSQSIEQLSAEVRKLCGDLQQRPTTVETTPSDPSTQEATLLDSSTPRNPLDQADKQSQLLPSADLPAESSQQTPISPPVDQASHRHVDSDPLLSWISPLLDDF